MNDVSNDDKAFGTKADTKHNKCCANSVVSSKPASLMYLSILSLSTLDILELIILSSCSWRKEEKIIGV